MQFLCIFKPTKCDPPTPQFLADMGQFIEAKELIGGFALIQTKTKAEVIEWTKRFLKVAGDGVSEIRKVSEGLETQ
ncbi:MAG: YciI family protein [Gammaproteobacteria bacterium]